MRLKVSYLRSAQPADLLVEVDPLASVGDLAAALAEREPDRTAVGLRQTLEIEDVTAGVSVLDPGLTVSEAGLASGQFLRLAPTPPSLGVAAVLNVVGGPATGRSFNLRRGVNWIGRDESCEVALDDSMVSRRHARIQVGPIIEVVDENSSNGIVVNGQRVERVELAPGERVLIGDSVVVVDRVDQPDRDDRGPILFNRSPVVAPQYAGESFEAPEPPQRPQKQRFPLVPLLMPLVMGVVLLGFISSQAAGDNVVAQLMPMIFILLSPLMMVGSWFETRRSNRSERAEQIELFQSNLIKLSGDLAAARRIEQFTRCGEHPPTSAVIEAARDLTPLLWTRRPEHDRFLHVQLGFGEQPSRNTITFPNKRNTEVEFQNQVDRVLGPFRSVSGVPIVADLRSCGSIGVSGPLPAARAAARGVIAQLVGLHSPAELGLFAMAPGATADQWDHLKWLPHVGGDFQPIDVPSLASTAQTCGALVDGLLELITARLEAKQSDHLPLPAVVLVVEEGAPVQRSSVTRIMESGPEAGVHVLWVAPVTALVPAAARVFLEVGELGKGVLVGKVREGNVVTPVEVDPLTLEASHWLSRRLSPVADVGAVVDLTSEVPHRVSFVAEAGRGVVESSDQIIERWVESGSRSDESASSSRRPASLRALVGRSARDLFHLDLRTQGPHALVGGTTGAGKSEFLQTWILGMAVAHSPRRVSFLFVDYKGGAAFADCVKLPHCVGLVTDLNQHLVQRALVSLNAELRFREHLLNSKQAKDLVELERRGDPDTPPSLVIVVDEFAALVQEVPEFVDGVVNVAQRGRSLGLHLVLATQRPAGVIKDNLRANTNLRIALRVADEADSLDVVGDPMAGQFDPAVPGRAVAKSGPGRLALFQTAYVGGVTSDESSEPMVTIETLGFGPRVIWEAPEAVAAEPSLGEEIATDIERIVGSARAAAESLRIPALRRPWLPELSELYDLAELPNPRTDSELVIGVVDLPERQEQESFAYRPDVDGNLAVFGSGGSGKTSLLRSIAVSAGLTVRGGPCVVYVLDFGARGLSMLEVLPHVGAVVGSDDSERVARLLKTLEELIEDRAERFAAVNAGSIPDYRELAAQPVEPRVFLLLDGFSAFRDEFDTWPASGVFERLVDVASAGRQFGVHVVFTADRVNVVPSQLASSIGRRIALRPSTDMDEAVLRIPKGGFGDVLIPGRGFVDGTELQVAVLGGSGDVVAQASAIASFATSMRRRGAVEAPPIRRLPERVELEELVGAPPGAGCVFGLADESLEPIGFDPSGIFLVSGPAGSGRSTTVRTLVEAIKRADPTTTPVYLGTRRSTLAGESWSEQAVGAADVARLAGELAERWKDGSAPGRPVAIVDGVGEFVSTEADQPLQALLRVCRANEIFVIADGETSDLQGSWPLLSMLKASRTGIALTPDQSDGDMIFRTAFPRVARADWPVGRGLFVRQGRVARVQVAMSSD